MNDFRNLADRALDLFIKGNPGIDFITPDVRKYAATFSIATTDDRAWGSVMRRAKLAGKIRSVGYTEYNEGPTHTRPVTLWRAAA